MIVVLCHPAREQVASPPPGPTIILHDTFTASDDTLLVNHVMEVGPGWQTVSGGGGKIVSNKAVNASGNTVVASQANQADAVITADVTSVDAGVWDLVGRLTDTPVFWLLEIYQPSGTIALYEFNGSFIERASVSFSSTLGETYAMKLEFNGTSIKGFVNGTEYISYTSSVNQQATKHGIRLHASNMNTDNFKATTL